MRERLKVDDCYVDVTNSNIYTIISVLQEGYLACDYFNDKYKISPIVFLPNTLVHFHEDQNDHDTCTGVE